MRTIQTAQHIARRGTYGQNDGSLTRGGKDSAAASLSEYSADSAIAEGREIATFKRMLGEHDWNGITSYVESLVKAGWARLNVERMLRQATVGVRI